MFRRIHSSLSKTGEFIVDAHCNMTDLEQRITISRPEFAEKVKRWVLLDTQLKLVNGKLKEVRDEKFVIARDICNYLETTGISNKKILIHDGDLKMYEKKEYSTLTFSFLEQHLGNIIPDRDQVRFIIEYLKEQREVKLTNDIRRHFTNM